MIWKTNLTPTVIQSFKGHLSVWLLLCITSCAGNGVVPKWDGNIWPGDSQHGVVVHKNDPPTPDQVMKPTDPEFDKGAWISYADIRKLFVIVQSCKQWKRGLPMMDAQEALYRFKPVIEDMQREAADDKKPKNK